MDIFVKFTKTTHQIWSCHVPWLQIPKIFMFRPKFVLNFRKSYQIWRKLAQEQKSYRQKTNLEAGNTPPPVLTGLRGAYGMCGGRGWLMKAILNFSPLYFYVYCMGHGINLEKATNERLN